MPHKYRSIPCSVIITMSRMISIQHECKAYSNMGCGVIKKNRTGCTRKTLVQIEYAGAATCSARSVCSSSIIPPSAANLLHSWRRWLCVFSSRKTVPFVPRLSIRLVFVRSCTKGAVNDRASPTMQRATLIPSVADEQHEQTSRRFLKYRASCRMPF